MTILTFLHSFLWDVEKIKSNRDDYTTDKKCICNLEMMMMMMMMMIVNSNNNSNNHNHNHSSNPYRVLSQHIIHHNHSKQRDIMTKACGTSLRDKLGSECVQVKHGNHADKRGHRQTDDCIDIRNSCE